jgi:hypothetical protein
VQKINFLLAFVIVVKLLCTCVNGNAQTVTKYSLMGKASDDVSTQGYRLDITDDGTGLVKGENISIVENGRKIIGDIIGQINYAKHKITFKELKVKNLRPGETQNDYCFFEINADYYIKDGRTFISGTYIGRAPNGKVCSRGEILLMGPKSVEAIHTEYIKKITEAKLLAAQKKIVTPPKKLLIKKIDSPVVVKIIQDSMVKKEKKIYASVAQGVSMYEYEMDTLVLQISDYDKEDGDLIALRMNDKILLDKYTLSTKTDSIVLDMKQLGNGTGNDTITVYAYNEGYYSPNSAKLLIQDGMQEYLFYACNNYQERKYLILRKKEQ